MKKEIEKLQEKIEELNSELEHIMRAIKYANERKDLDSVNYWYSEILMTLNDVKEEIIAERCIRRSAK